MIDAKLSVRQRCSSSYLIFSNVSSRYMNNDHNLCILLCTCITVSDFIFLRTRVYHVEGMTKYITTIQLGHSMSDQRVFCNDLLRFALKLYFRQYPAIHTNYS